MAECILLKGGGGGVSSDELTAKASQVLKGSTYVGSDTDDEAGTGTMTNNGAVSKELACGESYTVPEGYHSGSGKVTAKSLASQTDGTATAEDILSGETAYVDGAKVTGTMTDKSGTTQTASASLDTTNSQVQLTIPATGKYDTQSILQVAYSVLAELLGVEKAKMLTTETILGITGSIATKDAQTYYPTTEDQVISADQYLGGDQTIKALTQTNLLAEYIKTGVTVAINNGNADIWSVAGTFCADATLASAGNLISGQIAYGKDGTKYTGTLAVQSILSFSATPYSTNQITFTWKNPAKGAFSGVIIVGKTGSYPTSISDGTRYYKGTGSSSTASGTSTTTVSGFTAGTTYYFRAFSYAVKDDAEWVHETSYTASAKTTSKGTQTFTASGTFTVPTAVRSIDIFCVGGGGAAGAVYGSSSNPYTSGGGAGGKTATKKSYAVTPGDTFAVTIGAGGTGSTSNTTGATGGTTSFGSVVSATGGTGSTNRANSSSSGGTGGSGGSGGGGAPGGDGGSDGSDGGVTLTSTNGGSGQGTTTRAFGESSNTLYAGGGGAGGKESASAGVGTGGDGGGGDGGDRDVSSSAAGANGSANTGGGAGGCSCSSSTRPTPASGGSGICIVRWGY